MKLNSLTNHLVLIRAKKLLALELHLGPVPGLGAADAALAAQLDPGRGQDAAAVAAGKGGHVVLAVVQEADPPLPDVVHGHGHAEEARLGVDVAVEGNVPAAALDVEGRDGGMVGDLCVSVQFKLTHWGPGEKNAQDSFSVNRLINTDKTQIDTDKTQIINNLLKMLNIFPSSITL